jgi:shikimate kinase
MVFLIGYRGAGKSTIAKLLAEQLDCEWADSDAEIERRARHTIAELFASIGEESFRVIERDAIRGLLQRHDADGGGSLVVALGGGAVLDPQTRQLIRARGQCVWLEAPPEVLARRTAGDVSRPRLTDLPPDDEIRELLGQRSAVYAECADLRIDTGTLSAEDAAAQIAKWLDPRR